MKKFYLLFLAIAGITFTTKAQVILSENFEDTTTYVNIIIANPSGNDTTWIDVDYDGLPDQSGASRPDQWFITKGFADVDSSNTVMASNSWTLSTTPVANYLILPPIHLNDASGMLYWKSAPFQTPRYLDGYQVLVSTTQNDWPFFSDTLAHYAEMTALPTNTADSANWGAYQFSSGFQHGADGMYIEYNGDSARFRGILHPDSASLAGYAGQTIYIAFCHGTVDDNLLSIDEIMVTGSGTVMAGFPSSKSIEMSAYPNPTSDKCTVQYTLPASMHANLSVYDVTGKKVMTMLDNMCIKGNYSYNLNLSSLPAGNYNVVLQTSRGTSMTQVTRQ